MIYVAICDDDKNVTEKLKNKIMVYFKENNILADITVYTKSKMLQYDIEEGKHYDLILSDIEMPDIDGMKLASYIKEYLPEVLIIFITSHFKYAVDAYELSIFRYIPKTSLDNKLPDALRDAIGIINIQKDKFYVIQMASRVEKIPYHKILYIQRDGKNSIISLVDDSVTKIRKSLAQVFSEIGNEDFVYVDRGNIVNLAHVMGIKGCTVELENGICLTASQTKLEQVKIRLSEFWGKQI